MRTNHIDPRVKILIVVILSSFIIVLTDIKAMIALFIVQLMVAFLLKADINRIIRKLNRFLKLFVVLIIVQSVFNQQGTPLFTIGDIKLITDVGINMGLSYLLRLFAVLTSGAVLLTSKQKELIQALIEFKIPYDLAFMSLIGIRFLPLLMNQMQDTFTAIQLRGIDINKLKLSDKISMYTYIFSPVIVSTLKKAKNLSMSVEMRGFRANDSRTSLIELKMDMPDYMLLAAVILLTIIIVTILH
jgi:energy-coupling factor transport system permease protein